MLSFIFPEGNLKIGKSQEGRKRGGRPVAQVRFNYYRVRQCPEKNMPREKMDLALLGRGVYLLGKAPRSRPYQDHPGPKLPDALRPLKHL